MVVRLLIINLNLVNFMPEVVYSMTQKSQEICDKWIPTKFRKQQNLSLEEGLIYAQKELILSHFSNMDETTKRSALLTIEQLDIKINIIEQRELAKKAKIAENSKNRCLRYRDKQKLLKNIAT